jgi:hypothetical protein
MKFFAFLSPFLIIIGLGIIMDPFKVFFYHEEFYKGNFVALNSEMVCLKLFERNNYEQQYNSFIFGSSRSQAFKVSDWLKYLPPNSVGFHFDASGEGLYGIYNKLKFIDKCGNNIYNVLIVLDDSTMNSTENRKGHLFISPPALSGESIIIYYLEFIKANLNPRFLIGYFDYSLFGIYRKYMSYFFSRSEYYHTLNNLTGDLSYGYDQMIQKGEKAYYDKLIKEGVFYDREIISSTKHQITNEEVILLQKIHDILVTHETDYRIVISPLYDQIPFTAERMENLRNIFDANRIYDFSGVNEFTGSIYNYYETSHYRPHVGKRILEIIYNTISNKQININ